MYVCMYVCMYNICILYVYIYTYICIYMYIEGGTLEFQTGKFRLQLRVNPSSETIQSQIRALLNLQ